MTFRRHFFTLLNILLLSLVAWGMTARAGEDRLMFKEGGELRGTGHGFISGKLIWELSSGGELWVPLKAIDRIEYGTLFPDPSSEDIDDEEAEEAPAPETVQPVSAEQEAALPTAETPFEEEELGRWDQFTERWEDRYDTFSFALADWTKRFEFGGRFLEGNSDGNYFNLAIDFEKEEDGRLFQFENGGEFAETDGARSANRWFSNLTADFNKTGKWIMFVTAKNETNEFQNLDYRGSYSAGLGYRFYKDGPRRLITRLGPGLTHERFRDPFDERTTPDIFGEVEFNWPLCERILFEHKTRANPSIEDIKVMRVVSNYGVLFNLDQADQWSLKLGLKHEYNGEPNPDRVPSDYTSTLLLVYKRK